MSKEVLIKVGFILGTTQGLDQAGNKADRMANAIKSAGQATNDSIAGSADSVNSKLESIAKKQSDPKNKSSIAGAIESGLSGGFGLYKLLGTIGAAGAGFGKIASDIKMSGGPGLRGQGLSGMVMGVADFFSGRGTTEALNDFKLANQDFHTNRVSKQMEQLFERQKEFRDVSIKPITEADPLLRQQAELKNINRRQADLFEDAKIAAIQSKREIAAMANQRFMKVLPDGSRVPFDEKQLAKEVRNQEAMLRGPLFGLSEENKKAALENAKEKLGRPKGQDFTDDVALLKAQISETQTKLRYSSEMKQLAQQELDIITQQTQLKKQTVRSGMIGIGAMEPMQQEFALQSLKRMNSGQQLAPEEIAAIGGLGDVASDRLNKYLIANADKGLGKQILAEGGDPSISKAAKASIEVGGKIDVNLEQNDQQEAVFKKVNELTKKLQNEIFDLQKKLREQEIILHNRITIDKNMQIPGGR